MSWHRIDKNTYIDDTLVTCAEYQLFIDEMREHREYFQPDHWTSYNFPEGKAHELILGVHHSDAVMFCEWITKREAGQWSYRLPTQKEVTVYPTSPITTTPLGYWIDGDPQFAWIGSVPEDALKTKTEIYQALKFDINTERIFIRALDLDIDTPLGKHKEFPLNVFRFRGIEHHFDLEPLLTRTVLRVRNRSQDIKSARINEVAYELSLDIKVVRILYIIPAIIGFLTRAIGREFDINNEEPLENYINLFTLQERIAGRSPAFEGIRLVKERIR